MSSCAKKSLTLIIRLRHSSATNLTSMSESSINVMNVSMQTPRNLWNSATELLHQRTQHLHLQATGIQTMLDESYNTTCRTISGVLTGERRQLATLNFELSKNFFRVGKFSSNKCKMQGWKTTTLGKFRGKIKVWSKPNLLRWKFAACVG